MKSYKLQVISYKLILLFLCSFSFVFAENIKTNLENNVLDLGRVSEGAVLTQKFLVTNNSGAKVAINVEALSCGCFELVNPKGRVELASGNSQEIIFKFNATGFFGKINKFLYIFTSDKETPIARVEVLADVLAKKENFVVKFSGFSSLTVLGAGLVDGINPCAFTVMVFFISFLSFAGYRKREIVIVAGFFILAVYITYILIGLGLFNAIRSMSVFFYFSRIFYFAIGVFVVILGLVNLYDFWIYKKTKDADKVVAKLPHFIKRKIQAVIRQELFKGKSGTKTTFALILASLSCGFLISVLEFVCTGTIYLPIITYILKVPELKMRALFYLLIYNLMFILPLIGVFVLAFFGLTSQRFEKIARKNLAAVKLATALLFFGLGAFLLLTKG